MPPQKDDHPEAVVVGKEEAIIVKDPSADAMKDHPDEHQESYSIPARIARYTARNPLKCILGSLLFATIISIIGVVGGDFKIEVDNKGWRSRGTVIANREMQNDLILRLKSDLFEDDDGSLWDKVENEVQRGYMQLEDRGDSEGDSEEEQCNANLFYYKMLAEDNLFATYQAQNGKSILDADVLFQICEAETKTNDVLIKNKVCGCDGDDSCPAPASLVWILRQEYSKSDLSCSELMEFYTQAVQEEFTDKLVLCTEEVLDSYDSVAKSYDAPNCPTGFQVSMVDTEFAVDGKRQLTYSSSYFFTSAVDNEDLFEIRSDYEGTDDTVVSVAYDTLLEVQNNLYVDSVLIADMTLAMASMLITITAMAIHTKSIWLTFIGLLQIIFSVPLAYFVYYFVAGLRFFPFLNFIGIFVAAALGADYIFVTVDKWKNARLENQTGSTEDIAAIALPSAASAMLLTTSTTAVAFFATTICPVTPILAFALYCGLLILFNYIMNILILFPALCFYDIWLKKGSRNPFVNCGCCSKSIFETRAVNDEGEKEESFIHRVLGVFYKFLHQFRYVVLLGCLAATGVCLYIALTMKLPDNADVRLLPESSDYEQHFAWKQKILAFPLFYAGSSNGEVTWGVLPVDNGKRNDPDSLSTIVLDTSFEPSTTEAQTYLLNFCDKLFDAGVAGPLNNEYLCPVNEFDGWLRNQTASSNQDDAYTTNCDGADSLPMAEDKFDQCIIAWSELTENQNILEKRGKVVIIQTRVLNSVGWTAPFLEMDEYWKKFEEFMESERNSAPEGVNKMFHTSGAFWWYDTNISMLQTAIGAALIAVSFSAVIVFVSSRSFVLTIFAALCITYVLAATTASLVGFGWDLGFLESICFAILIGISCDFVIHFGHAYNHLPGDASRSDRTKFAMIHMGPSILAAAFTTFSAAAVMLFCIVTFFQKFALILLMTILHATGGSFIVYLILTDCFGPSEPTKFVDSCLRKLTGKNQNEDEKPLEGQKTDVYDLS